MNSFLCPQCGAELKFTSRYAVSTVCEFCRSLVVRHDLDLDILGTESLLQDDLNPIQVGTQGLFQKTAFQVVGGVRLNHHEGYWDEWFLELANPIQNSKFGWLAQAQGEYQFLFEPIQLPALKTPKVGDRVDVEVSPKKTIEQWAPSLKNNADAYGVVDIRTAQMTHFQGQLPWAPDTTRKRTIAELASAEDAKLTIEFGEKNSFLYFGKVMYFDDFKFQNLKEVKGW